MISALVIGLVGSLHCIGMCGPLMLTFAGPNQSKTTFLVYHSGRILSYVFIGLILGLVGESFQLLQIQKVATILVGAILLAIYLVPKSRHFIERLYYRSKAFSKVKSILSTNLSIKKRWFVSGVANGFLPCGLTYVAAAGALVLGGTLSGASFMVLFGIGTLPGLTLVAFGGSFFSQKLKRVMPSIVPILGVLSGAILLFRGIIMTFPDFHQLVRENAIQLITICGL